MNILIRFSRGCATLGGGVEDSAFPYLQLSSQKENNNETWHKYSLYTYKHFGIKIYDVNSYTSRLLTLENFTVAKFFQKFYRKMVQDNIWEKSQTFDLLDSLVSE